jgi:GntP family gluconate:H+ symporter
MFENPGYLLGVLAVSIVLLVVLINGRAKMHPFLALAAASLVAAVASRLPAEDIPTTLVDGAGSTLGQTGIVVFLGAMLGRLLADSGAVSRIADLVVRLSSPRSAPWVMSAVAFMVAIPMFFDVGLVMLMPVIYAVALRLDVAAGRPKTWYLQILIPAVAALSCLHAMLPPHPDPMIAVNALDADIGLTLGLGLICAIPAVILAGPVYARLVVSRFRLEPSDDLVRQFTGSTPGEVEDRRWAARSGSPVTVPVPHRHGKESGTELRPVPTWTAFVCVLVPVALTLFSALVDVLAPDAAVATPAHLLGHPVVAMLVAVLVAGALLSRVSGMSGADVKSSFKASLGSVAGVALIIAGGGMFNQVLTASGIDTAVVDLLGDLHINEILLGWLIGLVLAFCTGSSTVGIVSATGILAPLLAGADPVLVSLVVIATSSGSLGLNWVNHAGFWFIKESFGMSLGQATKTHMAAETIVSVVGLAMALFLSLFI